MNKKLLKIPSLLNAPLFFFGIFLFGLISLSQAQGPVSAYDTAFAYTNYSEQQYLYGQPNTVAAPSIDLLNQDVALQADLAKYNNALADYADYYLALQMEVLNEDFSNSAAVLEVNRLEKEFFQTDATYQAAKWQLLEDAAKYDAAQTSSSSH